MFYGLSTPGSHGVREGARGETWGRNERTETETWDRRRLRGVLKPRPPSSRREVDTSHAHTDRTR